MPGFIGSSNDASGSGSEIFFPKEFIDPVTKLRISQPENLIDTDFEYGLQPTKWETVELINNTPSFFSKSGDTTIPAITSITTNAGTREITVVTALDHGLAVGIPIQVTGTKSITADGSYIINSIPNATTFTYLCKDDQPATSSIEDLYSSIITGEFFQGSQIRVSDASGIATDGASLSEITVTTESTHGFGINTPFYFLNLNSTISQEFQSANTASKSFDSSNSATAQTFDGSNTLSSTNIDWSNSGVVGGNTSTISAVSTSNNTITVSHGAENFNGKPLGTPLYYDVVAGSGYFNTNPRGFVFINSTDALGISSSTFEVSDIPGGETIVIDSSIAGTFQLANQARTFAGNNVNPITQVGADLSIGSTYTFEAANDGALSDPGTYSTSATISSFSAGLITVTVSDPAKTLDLYQNAMVIYSTTGAAATGLTNNTTYWVDDFFATAPSGSYRLTLKALPNSTAISSISGGTGTQTLTRVGVSLDKDIVHVKNSDFAVGDMLEYEYPTGGAFGSSTPKNFYFVETKYDTHNYVLSATPNIDATGGSVSTQVIGGITYRVHQFLVDNLTTTKVQTFDVLDGAGSATILLVGGGGGGGSYVGGGGGGGGLYENTITLTGPATYTITTGGGGWGGNEGRGDNETNGANSSFVGPGYALIAVGGGRGARYADQAGYAGGSGGGPGGIQSVNAGGGAGQQPGTATGGFGNRGANHNGSGRTNNATCGGGGGGAGGIGQDRDGRFSSAGGVGRISSILGTSYYFAGGGGGGSFYPRDVDGAGGGGNGGAGGGGGGGSYANGTGGIGGGSSLNTGANGSNVGEGVGGNGGLHTGGGGGGCGHSNRGGHGGSGIVVIRYKIA